MRWLCVYSHNDLRYRYEQSNSIYSSLPNVLCLFNIVFCILQNNERPIPVYFYIVLILLWTILIVHAYTYTRNYNIFIRKLPIYALTTLPAKFRCVFIFEISFTKRSETLLKSHSVKFNYFLAKTLEYRLILMPEFVADVQPGWKYFW